MSEMNTGVKILIDRMRTNPEDFAPPAHGRDYITSGDSWRGLAAFVVEEKERVFTDEEKEAVSVALREVSRKNFTAKILEILAAPAEDEFMLQKYAFQEALNNRGMIVAGTAVNTVGGFQTTTIPPKQRLQK